MMIPTSKGEIPRDDLRVEFEINEEDNAFSVACKWFHDKEEVRRDVWVNLKCGLDATAQQGKIGG